MKKWVTLAGVGAACAACCAPLVLPVAAYLGLGGFSAAGAAGAIALGASEWLCLAAGLTLLVALAVGYAVWKRYRRQPETCEIGGGCDPHAEERR
ncbi:MAG: hypothetical protein HY242_07930 [Afipia sp.]|nr:hypothetical protein [Afipia sp.]